MPKFGRALLLSLFLFLPLLQSCSPGYSNYCVQGVEEFVADSYLIKEGKSGILELQGWCWEDLPEGAMCEYRDLIEEDDILNIAVYHPGRPDLMQTVQRLNETIGFRVIDGLVNIPDLEEVPLSGLTLREAREEIQLRFRQQIQGIDVFVSYRDRLSRRIEFLGMCGASVLPVDGKMRLFEALSLARIPVTANLHMSYVVRDGCPLSVDMHRLIVHGDMCQNIVMHAGDKVFIAPPETARITVMGEVYRPVPVNLPIGHIPLQEALVAAGGIRFTGDRQRIQVIRSGVPDPRIYVLSWEHIIHLPNESLLLMPGDTVYISEKPITSWNRFISQLLPSFTGLQTGYTAYNILK